MLIWRENSNLVEISPKNLTFKKILPLQHILNALQILSSREAVVSALTPHGGQPSTNKSTSNPILEAENANKV